MLRNIRHVYLAPRPAELVFSEKPMPIDSRECVHQKKKGDLRHDEVHAEIGQRIFGFHGDFLRHRRGSEPPKAIAHRPPEKKWYGDHF